MLIWTGFVGVKIEWGFGKGDDGWELSLGNRLEVEMYFSA